VCLCGECVVVGVFCMCLCVCVCAHVLSALAVKFPLMVPLY
jgi:hypothetical protein